MIAESKTSALHPILFDIQHYAVHDGPGIRTLVFFKGCPLCCAWCCNPESQSSSPQLRHVRARCKDCLRCAEACPLQAITRGEDGLPVIDRRECARCEARPCLAACFEAALQMCGFTMRVDEIVDRVAADIDFYRNSGGGVTASGGEPFAQPRELLEVLSRCKDLGIDTAIETCGHTDPHVLADIEPMTDLFLYDIKLVNPIQHRKLCGTDNELILSNLRDLTTRAPEKILVRVPIVPGITDTEENLDGIAELLCQLGLREVGLEPYHSLGTTKYADLGMDAPPDPGPPSPETMHEITRRFLAKGIGRHLH